MWYDFTGDASTLFVGQCFPAGVLSDINRCAMGLGVGCVGLPVGHGANLPLPPPPASSQCCGMKKAEKQL